MPTRKPKLPAKISRAISHISAARKLVESYIKTPMTGNANTIRFEMLRRVQAVDQVRDAECWVKRLHPSGVSDPASAGRSKLVYTPSMM